MEIKFHIDDDDYKLRDFTVDVYFTGKHERATPDCPESWPDMEINSVHFQRRKDDRLIKLSRNFLDNYIDEIYETAYPIYKAS